jgi:hypothetical protein
MEMGQRELNFMKVELKLSGLLSDLQPLTPICGRIYNAAMDKRVDSLSGAGIQLARKKQILIFRKENLYLFLGGYK